MVLRGRPTRHINPKFNHENNGTYLNWDVLYYFTEKMDHVICHMYTNRRHNTSYHYIFVHGWDLVRK